MVSSQLRPIRLARAVLSGETAWGPSRIAIHAAAIPAFPHPPPRRRPFPPNHRSNPIPSNKRFPRNQPTPTHHRIRSSNRIRRIHRTPRDRRTPPTPPPLRRHEFVAGPFARALDQIEKRLSATPPLVLTGKLVAFIGAALLALFLFGGTTRARQAVPEPVLDPPAKSAGLQTAVFAGGCFWGVEAVFEHVKGVRDVVSGYAGGKAADAHYEIIGSGLTGHAESVRVTFDPKQVSYGQLLKVFFSVAHDPTQLNRQGPDRGSQYRSAIFYSDAAQKGTAQAYIAQMSAAGTFGKDSIVTQLSPLKAFYPAESYHQDFARLNPTHPYIVVHDAPKVARLKARYPQLYRAQLAGAAAKG